MGLCGVFGKINILLNLEQQSDLLRYFNSSLIQRLYGTSEFFYSMLFVPKYEIIGGIITWVNKANYLNYIGLSILIIAIIGLINNRKDKFIRACGFWLITSLFLFIVINWNCTEAPLFNLYFSWAIIPLFVAAFDRIDNNIKKHIFTLIILLMFLINIPELINIYNFIK